MNKQEKILAIVALIFFFGMSMISAMTINSVNANNFQPGSEQEITLKIKNTLKGDTKDVSLLLDTSGLPFSIIKSDNDLTDIDEDDTENFDFTLKASNDAKAGDYSISYVISYEINNVSESKNGTFTLTVEANPDLVYTVSTENPVVGSQGKIKLKIINKGFGDAKFANAKIVPDGFALLSEEENYIGTISSDDSETISFDVIFQKENPALTVQIEYRDFENEKITKNIKLPVQVYSKEEALQLGIIKPNNTIFYIIGAGILIVLWIIIRKIRKKRRLNKAQGR